MKLPSSQAPWFIQGTAVHTAVETWEKSYRSLLTDSVLQVYEDTWEEEESKAREKQPDLDAWRRSGMKKVKTDLADRRVRGRDQVLTYLENTVKERLRTWITPDGEIASEIPFEEDFGGVLVKGYIDLVKEDPATGVLLIRDVKTGAKKPAGWIQLATYKFALQKKYGVDIAWGDYWMCKDEGPSPAQYLGDIPEVLITSQYQIMDAKVQEDMYAANVGDHCGRCDVAQHCPFAGGTAPEGIYMLGT